MADFPGLGHGFLSMPQAIPSTRAVISQVIAEIASHIDDLAERKVQI
jgi:hypothetical protein